MAPEEALLRGLAAGETAPAVLEAGATLVGTAVTWVLELKAESPGNELRVLGLVERVVALVASGLKKNTSEVATIS